MRHVKRLRTAAFLLAFSTLALASGAVYAHDGSAYAPKGLSAAARLASASHVGAGPMKSFSGSFHIIYGDALGGSGIPATSSYLLVDDQGQAIELLLDGQALRGIGGARAINHRRVTVTGQAVMAPLTGAHAALPLLAVEALQHDGPQPAPAAVAATQAASGPQPWATILCRFADFAAVTPRPVSWFNTLMLGTTPPGLDHYWRELSFNNVNLTGSAVYGWYTLPQPRSYYSVGSPARINFQKATEDCTAVADADVYFPDFVGINLIFNSSIDCCAYGGSYTLTRDGQTRTYRTTWIPDSSYEHGVIAHEMGHAFGLPHSTGPTGDTDSRWDIMSNWWRNWSPPDPNYGLVGMHTISFHKNVLGWIPSARKHIAAPGTNQTIMIERLALPNPGTSYLMAEIPISGSPTQFYTVESRRFAGYDAAIPGEAVVIHEVDTTRAAPAKVMGSDNNGTLINAGRMWLPGDTFVDSANGITISVVSATDTAFQVGIQSAPDLAISVTASPSAGGTVSGGGTYAGGSSRTVTATPNSGYTFSNWMEAGSVVSSAASYTFTLNANRTLVANFTSPVVEFFNTILDNYFVTADSHEAAAIDNGSAGPGWNRTGNTFNSGGNTAVCRFYGSVSPGPNSHFYTVDASECAFLRQLQASTPVTVKRWNFESLDFVSTPPTNGACPAGSTPVYRAYNNGDARGVDSNHRITSSLAALQQVVARGWRYEGVVMCAPN